MGKKTDSIFYCKALDSHCYGRLRLLQENLACAQLSHSLSS